jgi:PAS domain S-box-containing protein
MWHKDIGGHAWLAVICSNTRAKAEPMIHHDIDDPMRYYPDHQATLHDLDLSDRTPDRSFDQLAHLAATLMRAPITLLSLLDDAGQMLLSGVGVPATWAPPHTLPQPLPFCRQVLATSAPLMIADAHGHQLLEGAPFPDLDIAAYAGAPLVAADGTAIGTLCAIDIAPHVWTDDDLAALQSLTVVAANEIALHRTLAASRRREAALRADAARSRAISELTSDYVFSVAFTPDGEMFNEWMTSAFERITGYTPQDFGERGLWVQLFHPDDIPIVERIYTIARAGQPYVEEFRIITKSGETRWLREYGQPEWDAEHQRVVRLIAATQDITEAKRAEETIRESEHRYRLITENANDLISLFDAQGRYVYASPSHQLITGYDPAALVGARVIDFVHPDDSAMVLEQWRTKLSGSSTIQVTFRYRHADGAYRWCEGTIKAIIREGSRYVVGAGRDVTERKRLESQLQHAQKMESVGRLAGGIAHDFNNLLAAIIGYADLVAGALPVGTAAHSDLAEIQKAARRAASLTRQLLAFARRQVFAPQPLNLSELILDMDKLLRRLIGADIELLTLPGADLQPVKADPGQLEQVLVNLVVNARDAMPDGGKLMIETANADLGAAYVRNHIGVHPGPYVLLAVSDSGVGMSEEVKRHLFEPFFTTKEPGKGTGLGLATCYGIVKQHGGNIWAYSEVGHGTTIKVYLPCAEGDAMAQARREAESLPPRGAETILLVEDEEAVRTLNARVLRAQGYTVLEAANGVQALEMARSPGAEPINLLLTDIVMPLMGGKALADQLASLYPNVRVLYTSGYTENMTIQHDQLGAQAAFIQKPASPVALARKVREVLDT